MADEVSRYMVALVNETSKPEQGPDRGQSARSLALPGAEPWAGAVAPPRLRHP